MRYRPGNPQKQHCGVQRVSVSGKSSLLFDTIYTEAQRQLIETLGSFARARLPKLSRPDVDEIKNLSTPIVIDQKKMEFIFRYYNNCIAITAHASASARA